MKIETAYSTEIAQVIDVETSYDLYWSGKISDKHNFECIFPDCDGRITAANLDRLRQDMSVDPYYKKVGDHTAACDRDPDVKPVSPSTDVDDPRQSRGRKSDDLADIFGLSRPPSHTVTVTTTVPTVDTDDAQAVKKRKKRAAYTAEPRPSTHYSLIPMVSKYHKYRKQGIEGEKFINIKGYNFSYAEMFVPIEGQAVESLNEYPRVYFGKAYVNEMPTCYRIAFANSLTLNGVALRPSIFISKDSIQAAFSRKMSEAKFEELSKKKRPDAWVFLYSKPSSSSKDGKTYLNFKLSNIDYFDFREDF